MGYFKELPNIEVVNRIKTDVSIDEKVIIKNFFKRAKIREDVASVVTAFEYYQITENETPSQVAEKVYGEPELDWVILTTNNIINVQDDWPIDENSFNNYLLDKYGSESKLEEIHHYETLELKDTFGRVVLPEGLWVDEAFYNAPEFRNIDEPPPGITFPPIVIPGTIASASAILGNQISNSTSVVGIANLQSGLGYTSPPTVTFSDPSPTANASVNASVTNFAVSSFNTLVGGQGYLSTPTVTISPPPTSIQATASCEINPVSGEVITITELNGGSGYGFTTPSVTFTPPPSLIEGSYLDQSSLSVGTQVDGMFVSEDGLNLYTTNVAGSGLVKQFSMSIGWDVSTLTFVQELDVSADFSYCTGIEFKTDGTRMFVVGGLGGSFKLISYNLSTPWDISTATKLHEIFVASPGGIRISPNGLKLFFLKSTGAYAIEQYSLSTAWNILTLSTQEKSINLEELTGEQITLGFTFISNGSKLLTTGESTSKIYEFTLTNSYDLDGVTLINDFYVGDKISNPSDIFVKPDESTFFICGGTENKVFQYNTTSLAKATASLTNGTVTNININQPGIGYTVAPELTISAPFPAVQATAIANLAGPPNQTFIITTVQNPDPNIFGRIYVVDGVNNPTLTLRRGGVYTFDVSDISNINHPLKFRDAGGSPYTSGVTGSGAPGSPGAIVVFTVPNDAPNDLRYYCEVHGNIMGNTIIVTSGGVGSITLTNGGFGYIFNPSVSIEPAPISRRAFGVAILNETTGISTVAILDGGSNYTSIPTITFGTPDQIQNVFPGETYSQNNKTWKWNGTQWQEKFTEEFQYLDPTTSTILKTVGSLISRPVTNFEYERKINDEKRNILILKPTYLSLVVSDLRNIMKYDPESSTYINDKLKSSYNPKFTIS
jgi:hypothetical protein